MRSDPYAPALRFEGFKGEWREIKLQNACTFLKGALLSKSHLTKDGHPCILYGELYTKYSEVIAEVTSRTNVPLKKMVLSRSGDVLLPSSGETSLEISTASFLELDNVALGGDLTICRPKKDIDGKFLSYQINHAKKFDVARLAQGVSVVHIYPSLLKMLKVDIPPLPEQQKIASFFSLLDQRIEKQQEKISCLEEYKKGLMQKIFSQEIRFKNENGEDYPEWEEKRLGKVGNFYSGLSGKSKSDFGNGKGEFIQYMDVFSNPMYPVGCLGRVVVGENEKQNIVKFGDVLFTQSSETLYEVGISSVWLHNEQNVYLNSFCFGYRFNSLTDKDFYFIAFLMRSPGIREKIISEGQGSTRFNLASSRLENMSIPLPILAEQQRIGQLLIKVHELIEKNRELLEQWKLLKKGLLQQMFI